MSEPRTRTKYAYVLNDPVSLIDPFGLHWECTEVQIGNGGPTESCKWVEDPDTTPAGFICPDGRLFPGPFGSVRCVPTHIAGDTVRELPDRRGSSSGTSARIQCATQFGQNHSLAAGVGAIFGDKVGNNFVTQLFLGNTVSSLAKIGTDIFGNTTPTGSQVASMAIKGAGQGIPGLPPTFNPVVGPTRNAAVGAAVSAGYNVIAGVGQETLELGLTTGKVATAAAPLASTTLQTAAAAVAWGKFVFDAATFAYGAAIACRP